MTDTLTPIQQIPELDAEDAAGCGCCQPEPTDIRREVEKLEARRAMIEERLTRLPH